ncbi:MAG: GTPase [SAR324 cluster bacterium]|uniref:GTPase n=1 Tax=SAR324 cluster bacterium TaxID=2024889 RepID=A0A2A4TB53_9DELT|nr:MAG: GTPase [SAR324 cluster bacterium]
MLEKGESDVNSAEQEETQESKGLAEEELQAAVDKLIRNTVYGSMGVGLIPLPLVDLAALTAVQLIMLKKLATKYDIEFSKDIGKSVIGSLLASVIPTSMAGGLSSLIKAIPVIGQSIGVLTMPIIAGASTYALGQVFVQHFASGGTFLDLDPEKVQQYYKKKFEEGQNFVKGL